MTDPKSLTLKMIDQTIRFGGRNLITWESMSCYGVEGMEKFPGRIISEQLNCIFDNYLLSILVQVGIIREK